QMIDRLLFLLLFTSLQNHQVASQSMLNEFFSSAIDVFKPLIDNRRSHVREQSTLVRPMLDSQRDTKVLGAPSRTPLQDSIPICNGDGKLCAFIACQAENFKNDQTLANLNLAAQVMGDKKLRHQVGNNPEAINAVCMDSGMDESRCGTFTRGFQMISKLINSIEEPMENMQHRMPAAPSGPSMQSNGFNSGLSPLDSSGMETVPSSRMDQLPGGTLTRFNRPGVQRTVWRGANSWGTSVTRTSPMRTVTVERFTTHDGRPQNLLKLGQYPVSSEPIVPSSDLQPPHHQQLLQLPQNDAVFRHPPMIRRLDDYDFSWATPRGMPSFNPSWAASSSSSSQTAWGANSDVAPARAFGSQTWSSQGGAINPMHPDSPLERNDLLASFTPIPPTAAPLAFPTVKSVLPSMEDLLLRPFRIDPALEKMLTPIKIEPILRYRRHTDDFVRVIEHLARSPAILDVGQEEEESKRVKRADDYYDQNNQADAEDNARPSRPRDGHRPGSRGGGGRGRGGETTADDYYDEVDTAKDHRHRNSRPGRPKTQRNCFELLG
ncbi:hypothetical protein PENTCL1PPCAC_27438, partial [Pristionchus entomophagus]